MAEEKEKRVREPILSQKFRAGEIEIGGDLWPGYKDKPGAVTVWIKQWNDKHQTFFPKGSIGAQELAQLNAISARLQIEALQNAGAARPEPRVEPVPVDDDDIPF